MWGEPGDGIVLMVAARVLSPAVVQAAMEVAALLDVPRARAVALQYGAACQVRLG